VGKAISIVIAKTNVWGERRDLFILPFPFEWSNLGSAATFALPTSALMTTSRSSCRRNVIPAKSDSPRKGEQP
jgi:hypothetical protein